jgi:hypothetical protein
VADLSTENFRSISSWEVNDCPTSGPRMTVITAGFAVVVAAISVKSSAVRMRRGVEKKTQNKRNGQPERKSGEEHKRKPPGQRYSAVCAKPVKQDVC